MIFEHDRDAYTELAKLPTEAYCAAGFTERQADIMQRVARDALAILDQGVEQARIQQENARQAASWDLRVQKVHGKNGALHSLLVEHRPVSLYGRAALCRTCAEEADDDIRPFEYRTWPCASARALMALVEL